MTAAAPPSASRKKNDPTLCSNSLGADSIPNVVVHVLRGQGAWPEEAEEIVTRAAKAALTVAHPAPRSGELAVLLTDDTQLADLNRRFRKREGPTDVLSFPGESDTHNAPTHIGDIAIAYERCSQDAAELKRPLAFHLSHLVIHGVLHCLGHDHEREEEARAMEACERAALALLGWGEPYPDPIGLTQDMEGDEQ